MAESQQSKGQPEAIAADEGEFTSLLQKQFKPQSQRAREEVESAVRTLAQQALEKSTLIGGDVVESVNAMIAIMHHPDFQSVESAWRGLHHLVNNTETDEQLKIRVMNISKKDLHKTLRKFKGTNWDQSPIFKRRYEEEFGQLGGEPYGCLVGDYYFDHQAPDVEVLGEMAKIGAAIHAPFISGASSALLGMDSWQELSNPR